ncbi:NADPH-dependent FMN reductase [Streptomyces specialis]|uniref:NADPH-dependent FMN reductase n=1 Tax=Streptomyces specialis TaxID=498367 RepID=UPI00073ED11F|nr:NAD(P)H-dependent oxidoreductase [Streptomyces specialis]
MNEHRTRVVIIVGSVRRGRFGPTVADWFASVARRRGDIEVDVVDLAEAWLPGVLPEDGGPVPAAVRDLGPWLAAADAFVIVTPEYNHSFPAALKNAIDWYREEWRAKPVAFVSYGDAAGGVRAVEQLRLVFAGLEAVTVRDAVRFHDCRACFAPAAAGPAAERMLDRLLWWGRALRPARSVPVTA